QTLALGHFFKRPFEEKFDLVAENHMVQMRAEHFQFRALADFALVQPILENPNGIVAQSISLNHTMSLGLFTGSRMYVVLILHSDNDFDNTHKSVASFDSWTQSPGVARVRPNCSIAASINLILDCESEVFRFQPIFRQGCYC